MCYVDKNIFEDIETKMLRLQWEPINFWRNRHYCIREKRIEQEQLVKNGNKSRNAAVPQLPYPILLFLRDPKCAQPID